MRPRLPALLLALGALALALGAVPAPAAVGDATLRPGASTVRTLRAAEPAVLWLTARAERCAVRATVAVRGRRTSLWVRGAPARRHRLGELPRGRHRVVLGLRTARCRAGRLRARLELLPGRERPGTPPAPTVVPPGPQPTAPAGPTTPAPPPPPNAPAPAAPAGAPPGGGASASPLAGLPLFSSAWSLAAEDARALRSEGRPEDAALLDRIAATPRSLWLADWTGEDPGPAVRAHLAEARAQGALPVFVAYRLPDRDCGGASAGGAAGEDAYRAWIDRLAAALAGPAAVVVEPDALAWLDCASPDPGRPARVLRLVRHAAEALGALPGVAVYLDAGHSGWNEAEVVAGRLVAAGVAAADGFALNVSNFRTTADELAYGRRISALAGAAHFIVDTSRNGRGPAPDEAWCNPPGRGLGPTPTTATGEPLADALLWVKVPGESDGDCGRGLPSAGSWWREGALALVRDAPAP